MTLAELAARGALAMFWFQAASVASEGESARSRGRAGRPSRSRVRRRDRGARGRGGARGCGDDGGGKQPAVTAQRPRERRRPIGRRIAQRRPSRPRAPRSPRRATTLAEAPSPVRSRFPAGRARAHCSAGRVRSHFVPDSGTNCERIRVTGRVGGKPSRTVSLPIVSSSISSSSISIRSKVASPTLRRLTERRPIAKPPIAAAPIAVAPIASAPIDSAPRASIAVASAARATAARARAPIASAGRARDGALVTAARDLWAQDGTRPPYRPLRPAQRTGRSSPTLPPLALAPYMGVKERRKVGTLDPDGV